MQDMVFRRLLSDTCIFIKGTVVVVHRWYDPHRQFWNGYWHCQTGAWNTFRFQGSWLIACVLGSCVCSIEEGCMPHSRALWFKHNATVQNGSMQACRYFNQDWCHERVRRGRWRQCWSQTLPRDARMPSVFYTRTRPDISAAVGILSRHSSALAWKHLAHLKRAIRYLQNMMNYGLRISSNREPMVGFSDSDWAGDGRDRRSTTGALLQLGGATLCWRTMK